MMTRSSDDGGYTKHQQAVIEEWQLDRGHFAFMRLTKYSSRSIITGKPGLAHSRAKNDQLRTSRLLQIYDFLATADCSGLGGKNDGFGWLAVEETHTHYR